jgi:hypothetical protein
MYPKTERVITVECCVKRRWRADYVFLIKDELMQLLDHFHPPLSLVRHWESFHARWAAAIADVLNDELLPAEYFAEVQVHVGSRVEVDVGAFADASAGVAHAQRSGPATATLVARPWAPPAPAMTMPAVFPDSIEVLVFHAEAGPTLVAAIELVSPGNKDRNEHRRAFAAQCSSYLQQGIGLCASTLSPIGKQICTTNWCIC